VYGCVGQEAYAQATRWLSERSATRGIPRPSSLLRRKSLHGMNIHQNYPCILFSVVLVRSLNYYLGYYTCRQYAPELCVWKYYSELIDLIADVGIPPLTLLYACSRILSTNRTFSSFFRHSPTKFVNYGNINVFIYFLLSDVAHQGVAISILRRRMTGHGRIHLQVNGTETAWYSSKYSLCACYLFSFHRKRPYDIPDCPGSVGLSR
jgi:hypothetical protein